MAATSAADAKSQAEAAAVTTYNEYWREVDASLRAVKVTNRIAELARGSAVNLPIILVAEERQKSFHLQGDTSWSYLRTLSYKRASAADGQASVELESCLDTRTVRYVDNSGQPVAGQPHFIRYTAHVAERKDRPGTWVVADIANKLVSSCSQ